MNIEFLVNLSQLLMLWCLILIAYRIRLIPTELTLALLLLATSPFWFNDLLFSPMYMPDQFRYLSMVESIRGFRESTENSPSIYYASWLMALMPIPLVVNVISIGFINKFLFTILTIWMYRRKYIMGVPLAFILFYPDMIMYSALALRDMLIFTFMVCGTILMINRRFKLSALLLLPLLVLKWQNFGLMLILWLGYVFFMREKFIRSRRPFFYFSLIFITAILVFIVLSPYLVEPIDHYRRALFFEDTGIPGGYTPISSPKDLIYLGLYSVIYFILKPLPFEAGNSFQLLQSVINIAVFVFLLWFTVKCFRINRFKTLFWLLFLLFCMMVYGIVVFNHGTASRYRFPFIGLYVIALCTDVYRYSLLQRYYRNQPKQIDSSGINKANLVE